MQAINMSSTSNTEVLTILLLLMVTLRKCQGQDLTFEVLEEQGPGKLGNIAAKANLTTVLGTRELQSLQYTVVEDSSGGAGEGEGSVFYVDQTTGDLSTKVRLISYYLISVSFLSKLTFKVKKNGNGYNLLAFNPSRAHIMSLQ